MKRDRKWLISVLEKKLDVAETELVGMKAYISWLRSNIFLEKFKDQKEVILKEGKEE